MSAAVGAAGFRRALADLINDPDVRTAVTYRRFAGASYAPETGALQETWAETETYALRSSLKAAEVQNSAGRYRLDDARFVLLADALESAPDINDRLTAGGAEFRVIAVEAPPLDAVYVLVARRA